MYCVILKKSFRKVGLSIVYDFKYYIFLDLELVIENFGLMPKIEV